MSETLAPRTAQCLSELRLDRLLAGELMGTDRDTAERHLAGCARCTARRRQRQDEQSAFRATWSTPADGHRSAATPGRRQGVRWRLAGLAALAAAVALWAIPFARRAPAPETITAKGQHWLRFFVRDGESGAVRPGTPAEPVFPGDALRFAFDRRALGDRYLAILGRDAAGKVTVYYPERGAIAAPAPDTADGLVPFSILLDATLGPEVLHALACDRPVKLLPLEQTLRRPEARLVAPDSCTLEYITLIKRAPR